MKNASWIVIDTETDGFRDPIHVLEIAGQRMVGWEPVGEKFRVLLNHKIDIPSDATAIHGYTTEFLEEFGVDPIKGHELFRDFAGSDYVVAHNLSFDWNRALFNEWLRLGLKPVGVRGFCTLMLSRRLIEKSDSYSLDTLRNRFNLCSNSAHKAFGDVDALVSLFLKVLKPRLESCGLDTYGLISEFSRQTPISKCLGRIKDESYVADKKKLESNSNKWYYLDSLSISHGPLAANEVKGIIGNTPCWIWREGLEEWVGSNVCKEFLKQLETDLPATTTSSEKASQTTIRAELIGLCRGIIADGKITNSEVAFLAKWLEGVGHIDWWPGTEILELVERIVSDDHISKNEKTELFALMSKIAN